MGESKSLGSAGALGGPVGLSSPVSIERKGKSTIEEREIEEEESKKGGMQAIFKGSVGSHESLSSGSKSSAGESSSDGGDYTDLPIVLEHQGEAQE